MCPQTPTHQKQIDPVELVEQYLKLLDWKVNENSNMSYSLQGLNNYVASEVSEQYWLQKVYPAQIRTAHERGDFHIHDLNLLSVYCVGWDLYDLLQVGFTGVANKTQSGPPKHFSTALGQIVNFFYTLQGEAAGAQAFSSLDTLLAPFIRADHLTYAQVKQELQEFVFNMNVPTRVGFQTPFTNITLDLTPPSTFASQAVIIGGEAQTETYGEFQSEMDIFNRALMEVMVAGDASGRVFTFPIPTYNITKDFNWENPTLDPLWQATAKYGLPYFSNFINSEMNPEDARSMCCRLRLDTTKLAMRGGGLFGAHPLTGSIGVVTLNLPRMGYEAKTKKEFFKLLSERATLAKESLEIKRQVLEQWTKANLYPYTKFYLRHINERFNEYWKNHFATIGIIGMNEACENLLHTSIATKEGRQFASSVLDALQAQLVEFQQETGNNYNLEATPAEGTTYRLALKDRQAYPDIITANTHSKSPETINGAPFYTNSSHLPVDYTDDLFELLDHQDELQVKYTGGTVVHLFLGEQVSDGELVKKFVRKICERYHLPYFTFTPTFSVCPECGYQSGEHPCCEKCGSTCEVYSRVVGFLRPVSQWNLGKKNEFILRQTYEKRLNSTK